MTDDLSAIRNLADRWVHAIAASDVAQLGRLMTDDIVVVHGNGRVLAGREAVLSNFASAFENLRVTQVLHREEIILAGEWAFDRARVHTTATGLRDGTTKEFDSRTITILRRDESSQWRVARAIGVVEKP